MRSLKGVFVALGIFALGISLAFADYPPRIPRGGGPITINNDNGGYVNEYLVWARRIGRSGRDVRLVGYCA